MAKYQKYAEYQDSSIDWMGAIPKEWSISRLKYIFTIRKRIAGTLGFDVLSVTQRGIKVKDTESGDGQLSMDYSKYQLVYKGDFAMNHMDLLTGYVDISKFEGVTSPDYRVFMIDNLKKFNSQYYLYLLQMGYKQKLFFHLGQGSSHLGRWRLPTEAFNELEYPIPSLNEQIQIANFLDYETAKIDSLIVKQEKLIELLKEKRQAVISHAVTKGLNPNVPMKDSGVEWLGDVPKHWKISHLKYIASIYGRIGFRGYTVDDIVDEGEGALVLSPSNIIGDRFSLEKRTYLSWKKYYESPEIMVNNNDILLVKTGSTFGKSTIILKKNEPMTINPQMALIKGVSIDPRFLTYLFNSNFIKGCIEVSNTGSGMPTMTQENINNFIILIPTLGEDKLIADFLDREVDQIELIIKKAESAIQLMQERRTALISSAVTGKIDVRNWQNPKNNNEAKTELNA